MNLLAFSGIKTIEPQNKKKSKPDFQSSTNKKCTNIDKNLNNINSLYTFGISPKDTIVNNTL